MELRSGRRLSSRSPPGRCADGGGEDRISSLPDDMLLQVLVRLRCARAAAVTSSLSRRWRGLWRHLVELSFREIPLDALDDALQQMWCVRGLRLQTKESAHVLVLDIDVADEEFLVDSDLFQQIAPFPEISVLEMYLGSYGHDFGGMMLDLLGACTAILRLKVIMRSSVTTQACPPDCLCDEFPNWRSQTIPLTSLEEIEIDGFEGTGPEVAFLKFLFRCATLMKKMTVRTSRWLCPDTRGYKKMLRILETNPSVQCYVVRSSGDF